MEEATVTLTKSTRRRELTRSKGVRVSATESQYERWQRAAAQMGLKLTDWARTKLDDAASAQERRKARQDEPEPVPVNEEANPELDILDVKASLARQIAPLRPGQDSPESSMPRSGFRMRRSRFRGKSPGGP